MIVSPDSRSTLGIGTSGSCLGGLHMEVASSRLLEVHIGTTVVGHCAYAAYDGRVFGRRRSYSRSDRPVEFWTIVLIVASGAAFLLGRVSWRS